LTVGTDVVKGTAVTLVIVLVVIVDLAYGRRGEGETAFYCRRRSSTKAVDSVLFSKRSLLMSDGKYWLMNQPPRLDVSSADPDNLRIRRQSFPLANQIKLSTNMMVFF